MTKRASQTFSQHVIGGPEKGHLTTQETLYVYLDEVYFVTALVPSDTACFASSPGKRSLTAV
jgi:hypothetical protein